MTIEIKHCYSNTVLYTSNKETLKEALEEAVKNKVNLGGADLECANLRGADLRDANLQNANLRIANLRGAYLQGVNLGGANLLYANLVGANLEGADLRDANLQDANLRGANLENANLGGANLLYVNLGGANLRGTNLLYANLENADLKGAKEIDLVIARTRILSDGDLIGYKKLKDGVICKLKIPEDAKRSHAFGRKCRASYAIVLEGYGVSQYDGITEYNPGHTVYPDSFDEDWAKECAQGIHFFITRIEAENY